MGRFSGGTAEALAAVTDGLVVDLGSVIAAPPVTHTYNPLIYARNGYDRYVARFGNTVKAVVLLGMNPGPFGMAQTGVPFGDVQMVSGWMGISADVGQPVNPHPKRPIAGFCCRRTEVSGRRLWGWAKSRFGTAPAFFNRFFVLNYCPLLFMERGGRNRTPDKLAPAEKKWLFHACDQALRQSVAILQPRWVVGVGGFAAQRAAEALSEMKVSVGRITHPSPANPKANRGWEALIESELTTLGIDLPDTKKQGLMG